MAHDINSVPDFKRGARSLSARSLNQMLMAIKEIDKRGDNVQLFIADTFLGVLDATGQTAYTDERYWVKRAYCSNSAGVATTNMTIAADTASWTAEQLTATNLSEHVEGTHMLPANTPVRVYVVADEQFPAILRYYFWGGNGGNRMHVDDLISIPTTASDGTRTISTLNWADRLVHYQLVIGYNPFGAANSPASSGSPVSAPYHDTFRYGSSMGSGWNAVISYGAGGGVLNFEIQGSTGNLRWSWINASSWPGMTWYHIDCYSNTAQKTAYDFTAP